METLVFGLGAAFLVIMGAGIGLISKRLREVSLSLQECKDAVLTGALGICRRLEDKEIGKTSHDSSDDVRIPGLPE